MFSSNHPQDLFIITLAGEEVKDQKFVDNQSSILILIPPQKQNDDLLL